MAEANQQQDGTDNTEASGGAKNAISGFLERIRSGELKARLHYFLFRKGQEVRRSDSLFSRYKKRLREDWGKWLGLGAGITGLFMLFNPEGFWLWQIPLVFILMAIAPAVFELPNTLNALFGHTEQQHLVGTIITLTQEIADGKGYTTLEDKQWQVSGPDCLAGTSVRIVTLDSKTLYVTEVADSNALAGMPIHGR